MENEEDEREQDDYMKTRDITLRNYQVKLLDKAKVGNVILYLPAGAGKTLIAVHVLCQGGHEIKRPFSEGGKRTFFVSNTKVLVYQLGLVLKTHTKFKVTCLTGDANIDSWSREKWLSLFEDNHVFVLTGEILRHILQVRFIKPNNINLIVFDECHHAVYNHPYKLVLDFLSSDDHPDKPHILGLTAVLLNSRPKLEGNVQLDIRALESVFRGIVVTEAQTKEILSFSAHPKESVVIYPVATDTPKLQGILELYDSVINTLKEMVIYTRVSSPRRNDEKDFKDKNKAKRIKNAFENSKKHLVEFGIFGGSLSALFYIILLEKYRLLAVSQKETGALIYAVTQFNKIRHVLQGIMGEEETGDTIRRFSSPKVRKLLDTIEEVLRETNGKRISILVFVYERATAIILAFLLKRLSAVETKFKPIKADFIVSASLFSKETLGLECKNEEILKQFTVGSINLLMATNILEEGIDVSACNVVMSFDFPRSYPSYFQSKGRARNNESTYYLFINEDEKEKKMTALRGFKQLEKELHKRVSESPESWEDETSQGELETINLSGKSGTFTVDGLTAIKAVDRYCSKLPQDQFSLLSCNSWFKTSGSLKKGFIQFPMNCPIVEVIEGEGKPSKKEAKRSVYLLALKRLHEMGELDDNLNMTSFESKKCFSRLFPQYKDEVIDKSLPQPGTKRRKQMHRLKFAESLSNCLPVPGTKAYIHVFDLKVAFDKPELERKIAIYHVLREPVTFAMISSKRLHKILQFPLFLDMGQINCDLLVNYDEIILSETEISDIKMFHFTLFKKVTKTVKSAQVFDNRNKEHSFFIAPVKKNEEGRFLLDWDLIRSDFCRNSMSALVRYNPTASRERAQSPKRTKRDWNADVPSTSLVPYDAINGRLLWGVSQDKEDSTPRFTMTEADYRFFILIPNYRSRDLPQCYIVDKFCQGMTPLSKFPTEYYDNFVTYYKDKYEIEITNTSQPLLKVSPLFNCSNFNKPRNRKHRRAREKFKEHEELLLPELCDVVPFDRKFWVKALILPTVLNRVCHVYLVEEFRRKIISEMGVGVIELPEGQDWKPLKVDETCMDTEEEEGVATDLSLASLNSSLPLSKLKDKTQNRPSVYLDPERHLYEYGLCDLEFYVRGLLEMDDDEFQGVQTFKENYELLNMMKISEIPTLNILEGGRGGLGPDLALLVQAFTSKSANDIVNYERLEVLGDSFLKFATTLFLFKNYEDHEGILTNVKGKLVGNKNLLYCGLAKNIQDVINVTDFSPLSDWNPPLLTVPERLEETILANNVDPAVLYRFEIEEDEQFSGVLSESTFRKNEEILNGYEKCCEIPSNSLLPYKTVSDKTISDCVEALLGAYLLSSGIHGALEFLCWMEVLPATGSFRELMGKRYVEPVRNSTREFAILNTLRVVFYTELEEVLNYRFQNKALLLEALTHPSYSTTRITNCYQRLEFLGDAVLDFLVTTYIYENCGNLTPGQVTDVRSALVNNITFACLVVRYELYKYMLSFSSSLTKAIENFVSFQARRDHVIDENVLTLLNEEDCMIAEAIQVPKALGDIFESLAGAIFLDSGNSLTAVWNVYYKLMKREIDEFTNTVPKTSVRLLSEICGDKPYYESKALKGVVKVSCSIYFNNCEITAHGFGPNKKEGKRSAAKVLLNKILAMKK